MTNKLEVWKFGGASLADAAAIQRASKLIAAHDGPLVVVASALAGITDLLISGAGAPTSTAKLASAFLQRHRQAVKALLPPGKRRRALLGRIDEAARDTAISVAAVAVLGHLEPRTLDLLVSRGERMSAALLAEAISQAGRRRAVYVDATELWRLMASTAEPHPHLPRTRRAARRALQPLIARRTIPVVPGYIGRAADGSVATLGRGGSDLTATLLGRSLGARQVVLWKDVPGILTADPRLVPDARLLPRLHHREAAEVAHYGAKVLHPRALIPIAGTRIILHVRSFLDLSSPGTEVSAQRALEEYPVKALAIVHGQAIVTVAGKGMVGVHGIAARTFAAVDAERLSVSTIFQASSESSIGFTVPEGEAARGVRAVRAAFKDELASGVIDNVSARPGIAVVAVVGDGMAGAPGIAARVFSALSARSINVVAIAQGSSERNISFAINAGDAGEAARAVHAAFQLSKIGGGRPLTAPRTDVVLLGFGNVGRALADHIAAASADSGVKVVGLMDRSGYIFEPRGLSRRRLHADARKIRGRPDRVARRAWRIGSGSPRHDREPCRVASGDCRRDQRRDGRPSSHGARPGIRCGAGEQEAVDALVGGLRTPDVGVQAGRSATEVQATVGAGLPIIDTYQKLIETGDRVLKIEGCVSGTLMHIASAVSAGRPFSEAVREAVERGYAEPDPRDDLSGADAGRKALILARLIGYRGPAPRPDNLVPRSLKGLSRHSS